MRRAAIGTAAVLAVGLFATAAAADETATPAAKKGEITIKVVITGRVPRPAVAVDIARVVPRAPLPELRQPLADRIGKAVEKDPF